MVLLHSRQFGDLSEDINYIYYGIFLYILNYICFLRGLIFLIIQSDASFKGPVCSNI